MVFFKNCSIDKMTMPTSLPRRFPEVLFPADFTALYQGGFSYAGSPSARGGGSNNVAGVSWPPRDGLASEEDLHRKGRQEEAIRMVRAAVQSRQRSRLNAITGGMAGRRGYQEMEGGCGECGGSGLSGGSFQSEGGFPFAGYGKPKRLQGGVMRTLAGRQAVAKRLTERVAEFNQRDAETFETPGFSNGQQPRAPPNESGVVVEQLGEHLAALSDAMTTGVWDKDTTKEAKGILTALTKVGHLIPQNQITMILRQVEGVLAEIVRTAGAPYPGNAANTPLAQKEKGILRLVYTILERAKTVLDDLSANSNLATDERRMRIGALGQTLARQTEAQRLGRLGGPARGYRAAPVYPGQNAGIFPGGVPVGWQNARNVPNAPFLPPGYNANDLDLFQ